MMDFEHQQKTKKYVKTYYDSQKFRQIVSNRITSVLPGGEKDYQDMKFDNQKDLKKRKNDFEN